MLIQKEIHWLGRSLPNYIATHMKLAESLGKVKELKACTTLTAARKVLYGEKRKHYTCCKSGCPQCGGKK